MSAGKQLPEVCTRALGWGKLPGPPFKRSPSGPQDNEHRRLHPTLKLEQEGFSGLMLTDIIAFQED